jgi:hypothetical protein
MFAGYFAIYKATLGKSIKRRTFMNTAVRAGYIYIPYRNEPWTDLYLYITEVYTLHKTK